MKILELEPTPFWSIFERITQIPRPSKHEDKILAWLRDFARERGLAYREDEAGNITILKEAQNSASAEPVALQSHVDMVCEKDPGIDIDFENDPIPAYVDGDHVRARGTTLGADCGIGMATALYILDDKNMSHPPIEALFTVDEETGLTGARSLGEDMITAPRLINLDSEDREEVFVGCAGGIDTVASFKAERTVVPDGLTAVTIRVGGLKGGHSGDDIDAGLANANLLLARVMHALLEVTPLWITGIDGGNLRNAIPREAEATVAIIPAAVRQAEAIVSRINSAACKEYRKTEPSLKIEMTRTGEAKGEALTTDLGYRLTEALFTAVNGVISMSAEIDGLVETSTNLASVKIKDGRVIISTSQRSSSDSRKEWLAAVMKAHFEAYGADVSQSDGYPGWAPSPDSPLTAKTVEAYREVYGRTPKIKAIHAGLECGLFLAKKPELDMVSIGPDIKGVHSPSERLDIESTVGFIEVMKVLLAEL